MDKWTAGNSTRNEPDGRAQLEQLADALTQQGYDTTVIVTALCGNIFAAAQVVGGQVG